jgi:hypothetical protein
MPDLGSRLLALFQLSFFVQSDGSLSGLLSCFLIFYISLLRYEGRYQKVASRFSITFLSADYCPAFEQ